MENNELFWVLAIPIVAILLTISYFIFEKRKKSNKNKSDEITDEMREDGDLNFHNEPNQFIFGR